MAPTSLACPPPRTHAHHPAGTPATRHASLPHRRCACHITRHTTSALSAHVPARHTIDTPTPARWQGLEADMDAAEAILDTAPELLSGGGGEASTSAGDGGDGRGGDGCGDGGDDGEDNGDDYDPEEIARMQAELDQDLADMFTQLQAVKAEAADISAHKVRRAGEDRGGLHGWIRPDACMRGASGALTACGVGAAVEAAGGACPVPGPVLQECMLIGMPTKAVPFECLHLSVRMVRSYVSLGMCVRMVWKVVGDRGKASLTATVWDGGRASRTATVAACSCLLAQAMLEAELRSLLSADGASALPAPDDGSALDSDETIAAHRG
eukprot:355986-Chlamydomonas_euryale.AAC.9